jgi:hypothetical protein
LKIEKCKLQNGAKERIDRHLPHNYPLHKDIQGIPAEGMRIWRNKRSWIGAATSLVVLIGLGALITRSSGHVEIRGKLSPEDIAEIKRLHQSNCPMVWASSCPRWLPIAPRRQLSAILNPIEIIAAPGEGRVIVVYRGFERYYFDRKGKHRWGHASYTLVKADKGWVKN